MANYKGKEIQLFKNKPLIDKRIIIKDTEDLVILKRGSIHNCEICGQQFKSGSRATAPFICSKHSFWIQHCDVCGEEYELTYDKMKIDSDVFYCSYKCYYKLNSGPGTCRICGKYVQERPLNRMCKQCTIEFNTNLSKNNSKPGICTRCGKYSENRSGAGVCNECMSKSGIENSHKLMQSGNCTKCGKFSNKRSASGLCLECSKINSLSGNCKKCNKYSEHRNNAGLCSECSKLLGLKTVEINSKAGDCTRCGKYSNKRDISGMCKECRYEVSSKVGIHNVETKAIPGICVKCGKYSKIRNVSGMCQNCSPVGRPNFLEESIQPCGHTSKSVLSNGEYVCWQCYVEDFENQMNPSSLQDFVEIPQSKKSIISEMNLGNIFLTLDEEGNPLKLSKNYDNNSLLYKGNLDIENLSKKLNISYGKRSNFMPEKLQRCGHTSKSVLSNGEYVCWQCYINKFNNEITKSDIKNFNKLPEVNKLLIKEMNLGNIFLTLDEDNNPLKLSKNYDTNSLLYKGPEDIKSLSNKLNISYGSKTNFMPEKLQPCGHTSKSVLSNGEYVCWQCYIEDFDKFKFVPKFKGMIIPTFLNQNDTNSIPGNKFETYLSDLGIGWFVYIKYHENGKPLVIGKSGSLLVNSNGSDLSFDRKEDGGPARQLLIDTSSNWNRTIVEILKVNSESEALNLEYFLQLEYQIFGS